MTSAAGCLVRLHSSHLQTSSACVIAWLSTLVLGHLTRCRRASSGPCADIISADYQRTSHPAKSLSIDAAARMPLATAHENTPERFCAFESSTSCAPTASSLARGLLGARTEWALLYDFSRNHQRAPIVSCRYQTPASMLPLDKSASGANCPTARESCAATNRAVPSSSRQKGSATSGQTRNSRSQSGQHPR